MTETEMLQKVAEVKPSPVSKWCWPCPRCHYERDSGQPWVALGLYTAEGLVEHLATHHGEVAK